jgi:hypothetical protein
VVQNVVVRVPPRTHAPLTILVNSGSQWSVEKTHHPTAICKGAGGKLEPLFIAKVRVAGSNPVVRSKETPAQRVQRAKKSQSQPVRVPHAPHLQHIVSEVFWRSAAGPIFLRVRVIGKSAPRFPEGSVQFGVFDQLSGSA